MKIQNPHDKFFKETLGNVATAKDFLVNYLPDHIMKVINVNTLELQKDNFINKELVENFSDLLFKVDIDEKEGYIYFLFEHKSYPDKGVAFQLLKYMVEIWEAKANKENKELPIVIPLVIYHGKDSWRTPSNLGAMLNGYEELSADLKAYVPNFNYLLYDLSDFSEEEIKGEAQLRILLTLLRHIFTKDAKELQQSILQSVQFLNELEDKQTGIEYLETMLRYVFSAGMKFTKNEIIQLIHGIESTYPEGREVTMSMADKWREEGWEKGLERGLVQGEVKALSETAIKLLTERFGKVPHDIKDGINNAEIVNLQLLLSNIFRYESIDDVKKYL